MRQPDPFLNAVHAFFGATKARRETNDRRVDAALYKHETGHPPPDGAAVVVIPPTPRIPTPLRDSLPPSEKNNEISRPPHSR